MHQKKNGNSASGALKSIIFITRRFTLGLQAKDEFFQTLIVHFDADSIWMFFICAGKINPSKFFSIRDNPGN